MKVLFLDLDGVLNGHEKLIGSPFCGIHKDCMGHLNWVLLHTGACIVLSSAWRYQIICGATTIRGFEYLLNSHGLVPRPDGAPRLIGHTPSDEVIPERGAQILASLYSLLPQKVTAWAAVDDLPLSLGEHQRRHVQTDPKVGLTEERAKMLIELLLE